MLDTTPDTDKMKWVSLPPFPGEGRILSTAAVCDSTLFIIGGCSLSRDNSGETSRTYLSDMIGYDMTSKDPSKWGSSGKQQLAGPGMPVAAAAGPAPVRENSILLIGGDKRGNSPAPSRPVAQSRDILVYDVIGNTWTRQGEWPVGIATVPAVVRGSEIKIGRAHV